MIQQDFQQDNDSVLKENFPDLNSIDHLLDTIEQKWGDCPSVDELVLLLGETWRKLPPQLLQKLADSMPRLSSGSSTKLETKH